MMTRESMQKGSIMDRREIGLVVFDWAGTVLDFGCLAPAGAFVQAFAAAGIAVSIAEARAPMGLHKKDHIRAMLAARGAAWTETDVQMLYELVTPLQVAAAEVHSQLVPELLECVQALRTLNVKIAGTTGYFHAAAEACYTAARRQGYSPDFTICADEVPAGRPAPWMIYRCMEALDVYPPRRVVKVGDTLVDVADGLNAGVWSVAVIDSSNEMGLSLEEFTGLSAKERDARREVVRAKFLAAGADAVLANLSHLPDYVRELNRRLTDSL